VQKAYYFTQYHCSVLMHWCTILKQFHDELMVMMVMIQTRGEYVLAVVLFDAWISDLDVVAVLDV